MRQTPAERAAFRDFVRYETRFKIGGTMADEGVVHRLAGILETHENYKRFRARLRAWCQKNKPYSWGILICIAEDSVVEPPAPAKQEALPFRESEGR